MLRFFSPSRLLVAALALVGVAGAASVTLIADVTDTQGTGSINWTTRVISCTGSGTFKPRGEERARSPAEARIASEKAAKIDALRNCLETVKGVRVTSANITVGNMMQQDGTLTAKIEGVIKGFKVARTRYFSDGGVEVDVEVPLDGGFAATVIGPDLGRRADTGEGPTGIVVDARGLQLVPILAPKILDDEGNEVYSAALVAPTAPFGVAAYHKDAEEAAKDPRVMGRPLTVKAAKVKNSTDVVLSKEDAQKVREAGKKGGLFAEGRVVLIQD